MRTKLSPFHGGIRLPFGINLRNERILSKQQFVNSKLIFQGVALESGISCLPAVGEHGRMPT